MRKERKKVNTGNKRNNQKKKKCYSCESDNHEIKDCDSGKISLLLTEQADE